MSLDIAEAFTGRTVFITGGTGFVGKVCLFKILSEIPDIKKIYVLCRGKMSRRLKKYLQPQERLQMEVLASQCFEPLRQRLGKEKWASLSSRLEAVDGDIMKDSLGLNDAHRTKIVEEAQLIIHLAATVNFNEKLDLAVQMNTLGGLRVLSLAKACKRLEAMVHVSTCYVNFQRSGRDNPNMEEMYTLPFDPEEMVKGILSMHPEEVEGESKKLLKRYNYPNTYTFTKSMGEQLVYRYRENVPVVVVRPSIIGCAYRDPFPGWVDALTAAGGILLTSALGVLRELNMDYSLLADIIPVDLVANVVLKALLNTQQFFKNQRLALTGENTTKAATPVLAPKQEDDGEIVPSKLVSAKGDILPFIYQVASSSTVNALTWDRVHCAVESLMKTIPKKHPKAVAKFDMTFVPNTLVYRVRFAVLRYLPYLVLRTAAMLPEPIGSESRRKLVNNLGRALRRADLLNREFHDFVTREWVYDVTNSRGLDANLSPKSRIALHFDPLDIDWFSYNQHYVYGMLKYIVNETGGLHMPPTPRSGIELFQRASSL